MSFLNRHKATIVLTTALVFVAGGTYFSGHFGCGANCPLTSLFSSSVAQAGPGCAGADKAGAACTKTTTEKASATTAGAGCCAKATQASATTANAGTCTGDKTAHATLASADGKACKAEDKEACIAKCMAEKGMTRAEAEKCWAACQASMVQTAQATDSKACTKTCTATCTATCGGHGTAASAKTADAKHIHSREACIDACIAKGMSRADAEAAADKCGLAGNHTASVQTTASSGGTMK
jgi:hypothetical protein